MSDDFAAAEARAEPGPPPMPPMEEYSPATGPPDALTVFAADVALYNPGLHIPPADDDPDYSQAETLRCGLNSI